MSGMDVYESVTLRVVDCNILNLSEQLSQIAEAIHDCEKAGYNANKISVTPNEKEPSLLTVAVLMRRRKTNYQEFLTAITGRDMFTGSRADPDDEPFGPEDVIMPKPEPPKRSARPPRPQPSKEVTFRTSDGVEVKA
jgi:hypothetical protein